MDGMGKGLGSASAISPKFLIWHILTPLKIAHLQGGEEEWEDDFGNLHLQSKGRSSHLSTLQTRLETVYRRCLSNPRPVLHGYPVPDHHIGEHDFFPRQEG